MSRSFANRRVVVSGYGMVTPLGGSAEETFARASRGESGIRWIRSFDTTGFPCRIAGEVDDAWLQPWEETTKLGKLDKFAARGVKLAVVAAREAVRQSRLDEIKDRANIGVSLGAHGDNPRLEDIVSMHRSFNGVDWDLSGLLRAEGYPYLHFFRRKPDAGMALVARLFEAKGNNFSIVSACAAGAQAIGEAYRLIRQGRIQAMIAGGCEATVDFFGLLGFTLIKALAERYTAPEKASRPFDRRRSGFVMSEGAGIMVLEELEHARARGAPIAGEILGYGDSADAYRITDTHPKGEGAVLAMQAALDDAALSPTDVEYINSHGTSTAQNDAVETLAIKKVFGERAKAIPVSSNKSMLGHAIAASGAIESILALLGMQRGIILPTINYEFPDPRCDLDYVPNVARHQAHRVTLSNSFGFGGQNACLCLGRYEQ